MNHILTDEQQQQITAEQSRRLHCLLVEYDEQLRALEADAASYKVVDYNRCFQAIQRNREQTERAIEELHV